MARDLPRILSLLDERKLTVRAPAPLRFGGEEFERYWINLSTWKLQFSERTNTLFLSADYLATHDPQEIVETLINLRDDQNLHFILVFVDGVSGPIIERVTRNQEHPGLIIIGSQERLRLETARSGVAEEFRRLVVAQLPLYMLSPYETANSVSGSRFFGREGEVRFITSRLHKSHAIVGIRKIGKSSLMREVKRQLERLHETQERKSLEKQPPDRRPGGRQTQSRKPVEEKLYPFLFIDCSGFKSQYDLMEAIQDHYQPKGLQRLHLQSQRSYFRKLMTRLRERFKRPLILLLDEIDQTILLDARNGWEMFDELKALSEADICHSIVAGFREAMRMTRTQDAPFFNFCERVNLDPFTQEEARQLIWHPMHSLGITFTNIDGIVGRIYHETGGHPNLMQYYCHSIIKQLDKSSSRVVTEESLKSVYDDSHFRSRLLDSFMENTENRDKALIFAILLYRKSHGMHAFPIHEGFSEEFIDEALRASDVRITFTQIQESLVALDHAGVLRFRDDRFYFYSPIFEAYLDKRPLHSWLRRINEEGL